MSDSPRAGESPGRQPGAPKEQPPRNLSGPRSARAGHSGKQAFAPHRRGKPQRGEALRSHDRGGAPPRCPHGAAWSREAPMTTPDIDGFAGRHIGPSVDEQAKMLAVVGQGSRADLVDQAVPAAIHHTGLDLPAAADEEAVLAELRALAGQNRVVRSMIGLGYYDTVTPPVIRRGVREAPGWYTAYTPYQPEISQGRLEALLNFQTVVAALTGLQVANASLLDEPTAAAEAMSLCRRVSKSTSQRFVVDADSHPHLIAVLRTRAEPLGIDVEVASLADGLPDGDLFGVLVSCPGSSGAVWDPRGIADAAHERGGLVAAVTDLLALTLIVPPGEWGADVAGGSAQRFGVPLGFGGPHAGFMAVRPGLERSLPGRLVGVSVDAAGDPAYRLGFQTRGPDIRRKRATIKTQTDPLFR